MKQLNEAKCYMKLERLTLPYGPLPCPKRSNNRPDATNRATNPENGLPVCNTLYTDSMEYENWCFRGGNGSVLKIRQCLKIPPVRLVPCTSLSCPRKTYVDIRRVACLFLDLLSRSFLYSHYLNFAFVPSFVSFLSYII